MLIKDKKLKKEVDVSCKDCPRFECYKPQPYRGVFIQGQGYRNSEARKHYVCGTRENQEVCPDVPEVKLCITKTLQTRLDYAATSINKRNLTFFYVEYLDRVFVVPVWTKWLLLTSTGEVVACQDKPIFMKDVDIWVTSNWTAKIATVRFKGDWRKSLIEIN